VNMYQLYHGDCLKIMPSLPSSSVNLIACDLPYFGVKSDEWDNQWASRDAFLSWVGRVCDEWKRLLAPNGSVYAFASPQMAWYVEGVIRERFNVLNRITWIKEAGWHQKQSEEALRAYFPQTEPIFFAEQCGSLGGSVIGNHIQQCRESALLSRNDIDIALGYVRTKNKERGTELCRRWEEGSSIPSAIDFARIMELCGCNANYEDLRRPFNATPDAPYTDVWTFPTVNTYPGKHPTEKPISLMQHIVSLSSRPSDTVLDCCMGHGTTGVAAGQLGRKFIGIEMDSGYFAEASTRIAAAYGDWDKARKVRRGKRDDYADMPLFAD